MAHSKETINNLETTHKAIMTLRDSGLTVRQIAELLHRSQSNIRYHIAGKIGIKLKNYELDRRYCLTQDDLQKFLGEINDLSNIELKNKYNISDQVIYYWRKKLDGRKLQRYQNYTSDNKIRKYNQNRRNNLINRLIGKDSKNV